LFIGRRKQKKQQRRYNPSKEAVNTMQAKEILAFLKTQLEEGHTPFEKNVVVRLGGRDYAMRSIDASTADIILEVGEPVLHDDSLPGERAAGPGGPEGEGVEPPPPKAGQSIMTSDTTPQENSEG